MVISPANRRTTLTLPASTLETARRLAHKRKVHLSVVVNEALEEGLRQKLTLERWDLDLGLISHPPAT